MDWLILKEDIRVKNEVKRERNLARREKFIKLKDYYETYGLVKKGSNKFG
jgi:hypothetical protein